MAEIAKSAADILFGRVKKSTIQSVDPGLILSTAARLKGKGSYSELSDEEQKQILAGYEVELEHGPGKVDSEEDDKEMMKKTNVTDNDMEATIKIVLAHLEQHSDYYTRLNLMEANAARHPHPLKKLMQLYFLKNANPTLLGLIPSMKLDAVAEKNRDLILSTLMIIGYPMDDPFPAILADQIVKGFPVELEHGTKYFFDVTHDEKIPTLKIVLAHLWEIPNYYDLLKLTLPSSPGTPLPLGGGIDCGCNVNAIASSISSPNKIDSIISSLSTLDVSDIHPDVLFSH